MKRLTTKQFVEKSSIIHKNRYDYNLCNYKTAHIPINIICPEHGAFYQLPYVHIQGHGCPKCANKNNGHFNSLGLERFRQKAIQIHGNKYDYSKSNYINAIQKVEIICPIHGSFRQSPYNHFNHHGCPLCGIAKSKSIRSLGIDTFITRASKIHNNFYDYSNTKYDTSKEKVKIRCPQHGSFIQNPNDHLLGAGCPRCNFSKGELKIERWLSENKISFISQHKFKDCRNPKTNYPLRFDFYVPQKNILIEYDGEQHFKLGRVGSHIQTNNELKQIQFRDKCKSEYAASKNIRLLRISYKKKNQISKILLKSIL